MNMVYMQSQQRDMMIGDNEVVDEDSLSCVYTNQSTQSQPIVCIVNTLKYCSEKVCIR